MKSLKVLSAEDVRDPAWRFASIGVLSHVEREEINMKQVRAFAAYYGLPLVKWRKPIDAAQHEALRVSGTSVDAIYANEAGMWDYYVKGCPAHININVKTSRGLVNGCMAVMDSITLAEGCGTLEELLAGMPADETELELSQPPHTINVVPDLPPDEMAVLVASGLSLDAGRLVVPVPRHPRVLIHKLRSQYSAVHGMPKELKVIRHQLELAFAYTDFKLQSKTKTKLIISIGPRKFKPSLSLSTIYVLASRVKLGLQLRVIGFDVRRDGHRHLTSLQHPSELGIWELGYRRDSGEWDDALRDEAIRAAIGGELPASLYDLGNEMDEDDLHEQEED